MYTDMDNVNAYQQNARYVFVYLGVAQVIQMGGVKEKLGEEL